MMPQQAPTAKLTQKALSQLRPDAARASRDNERFISQAELCQVAKFTKAHADVLDSVVQRIRDGAVIEDGPLGFDTNTGSVVQRISKGAVVESGPLQSESETPACTKEPKQWWSASKEERKDKLKVADEIIRDDLSRTLERNDLRTFLEKAPVGDLYLMRDVMVEWSNYATLAQAFVVAAGLPLPGRE